MIFFCRFAIVFIYPLYIYNMSEYPHIGKIIKAELKQQGRSAVWLASRLNYGTDNVYKIFQRNHLATDVLWKISEVLNHDFFKDVSDSFAGN